MEKWKMVLMKPGMMLPLGIWLKYEGEETRHTNKNHKTD